MKTIKTVDDSHFFSFSIRKENIFLQFKAEEGTFKIAKMRKKWGRGNLTEAEYNQKIGKLREKLNFHFGGCRRKGLRGLTRRIFVWQQKRELSKFIYNGNEFRMTSFYCIWSPSAFPSRLLLRFIKFSSTFPLYGGRKPFLCWIIKDGFLSCISLIFQGC